jgi:chaperonin cofactor prefoldin
MIPIFKNIKDELVKGIKNVSKKTNELTALGRLKIDVLTNTRDIEKTFMHIGKKVYQMSGTDSVINLESDRELNNLIRKVKELEKRLEKLNKRIETIRKQGGIVIQ